MIEAEGVAPRRYWSDNGHRVLIGLSVAETQEFEALDLDAELAHRKASPAGECGATDRNGRWFELYRKHDDAWKGWLLQHGQLAFAFDGRVLRV